jgi:hypothetical protein
LDREGRFWHDGQLVEHPKMAQAFAGWIARHPDDGRYILSNGFDWTYFEVEDVPFFVRGVRRLGDGLVVQLSDGSEEALDASALWVGQHDALYVRVKARNFIARFMPAAQTALAPWLHEGPDGSISLVVAGDVHPISERA